MVAARTSLAPLENVIGPALAISRVPTAAYPANVSIAEGRMVDVRRDVLTEAVLVYARNFSARQLRVQCGCAFR